jgi:hypothetical protein
MKKGGKGGSRTNITGLKFEKKTDLKTAFSILNGYTVNENNIYFNNEKVAESYKKNELYEKLLNKYNINWKKIFTKKLLPDEAIFVIKHNTVYFIEKKFQSVSGSTDEKLQTCEFKKLQYKKLLRKTNLRIEYGYILNDWFNKKCYKDVLEFIKSKDCFYYFKEIPFSFLGLPTPNN